MGARREYSEYLNNKYACLTPTKDSSVSINSSLLSKAASNPQTAEWLDNTLCGVCGKRLTRRNGTDLYCNRGYMVKDCECRQVVLGELKRKLRRVLDEEELRLEKRADVARSFLNVGEMTEEIWEQFVKGACVYPDGRIEVWWNFGDEMELTS